MILKCHDIKFLSSFCACEWILLSLVLFLLACGTAVTSESILDEAKGRLANSSVISYSYRSETNNLFNETKYVDSAEIEFYRISDSQHGFGLHVTANQEEYVYDGYHFENLKHEEEVTVIFDSLEVAGDSSYFSQFSFFATHPMLLLDDQDFNQIRDTFLPGQPCFVYINENQQKSHSDSTKIVKYLKSFFIEKKTKTITRVQDVVIRAGDTLQIIDHFFLAYTFSDVEVEFPKTFMKTALDYTRINAADEDEGYTYIPIQEGAHLTQSQYVDMEGRVVDIFGKNNKSCLIMFSFIGCAPCEMALKDFKEAGYAFNKDINFYYSSFQNPGETLKRYLYKKGFPNTGFGKESKMIEDFSLYHSPSFVFFDSNGMVQKVIEGYDERVKATLLELLSPE